MELLHLISWHGTHCMWLYGSKRAFFLPTLILASVTNLPVKLVTCSAPISIVLKATQSCSLPLSFSHPLKLEESGASGGWVCVTWEWCSIHTERHWVWCEHSICLRTFNTETLVSFQSQLFLSLRLSAGFLIINRCEHKDKSLSGYFPLVVIFLWSSKHALTWGEQAATAATDDLALAAHVGQFGCLQCSCFCQVYGNLAQTPRCMDLWLYGRTWTGCVNTSVNC